MASIAGYQHHRVNEAQLGYAPNGAVASDGFSILFDGKSLNADDASRWNNEGTGMLMLLKNPTLSAGLSYSAAGRIDHAYGTGQTVSDLGTVLTTAPSGLTSQSLDPDNYLSWMSKDVDGTAAQYMLAFQPATTNQSVRASLEVMEYS